ncbi:ThiF family adenylyltransferase [Sphingobacterium sp. SYP-B4668]|uniref:ThiF family adenylyltransferase n=1 Tax=Sphingobacterium sp. SYP-B4668 TaxID=2996035 RepID=UPI0022DE683C|nr:ThiF family adenylyltransferase [Sphingobacterium sp. SYP-B4668]
MIDDLEYKFPYKPLYFRIKNANEKAQLESLREKEQIVFVYDEIERQVLELIRCRYPGGHDSSTNPEDYIDNVLEGKTFDEYGVWIYYPWRKTLVHILDEMEFVEVRTNRNQFKITKEEQNLLLKKKVGIVGLSVGQSVALTMAMERTCGVLKLADFDELDLSNLNRLRTGIFNLSVPKVVIAAREIAEIDPYLKIEIFPEGLKPENYDAFFDVNEPLDLLVEVCDSFEVKLESRFKAKELKIPVLMDTNDRGMIDVERFDLNPDRPVFHGLAEGLTLERLRTLSAGDRATALMKIVEVDKLSARMKSSIPEIKRSLLSWPQLASEVVLGGAMTTDVCRRILLGYPIASGRYYVDMSELIGNKNK